ncbi:MAG: hypothetical protein M0R17_14165 [Candidatus Omnitrophica bacterium]|jgi:hypothetical protein|nr:hypothetical protein [Candidatus Omnitrophota bacterium]
MNKNVKAYMLSPKQNIPSIENWLIKHYGFSITTEQKLKGFGEYCFKFNINKIFVNVKIK